MPTLLFIIINPIIIRNHQLKVHEQGNEPIEFSDYFSLRVFQHRRDLYNPVCGILIVKSSYTGIIINFKYYFHGEKITNDGG